MKKLIIFVLVSITLISGYCIYNQKYTYDIDKACKYVTENAAPRSKCCCAWYVMRAMQSAGCPIGIYPAWFYYKVLPKHKFHEVSTDNYTPIKGDIVVIENSEKHFWGHIAMYNGEQWISDFKQKKMNPYKEEYKWRIFRYGNT